MERVLLILVFLLEVANGVAPPVVATPSLVDPPARSAVFHAGTSVVSQVPAARVPVVSTITSGSGALLREGFLRRRSAMADAAISSSHQKAEANVASPLNVASATTTLSLTDSLTLQASLAAALLFGVVLYAIRLALLRLSSLRKEDAGIQFPSATSTEMVTSAWPARAVTAAFVSEAGAHGSASSAMLAGSTLRGSNPISKIAFGAGATSEPPTLDAEMVESLDAELLSKWSKQSVEDQESKCEDKFACPVCQVKLAKTSTKSVHCQTCGVDFPYEADGNFLDLTIGASSPHVETVASSASSAPEQETKRERISFLKNLPFVEFTDQIAGSLGLPQSEEVESLGNELLRDPSRILRNGEPIGANTFRNPFVSFAYERGWRQGFAAAGFPGVDQEFRMAKDYLALSCGKESTLLDASCGSGLFSRKFAESGEYSSVIALDFSQSMLRQVDEYAVKDFGSGYSEDLNLSLVRADIARLPFETGSLDGVHAGAAIHCWPAPENGMAEVARVLKPGGVFVLSTFRPSMMDRQVGLKTWKEEELRNLTRQCGLFEFEAVLREPRFIMVKVRKPEVSEGGAPGEAEDSEEPRKSEEAEMPQES